MTVMKDRGEDIKVKKKNTAAFGISREQACKIWWTGF